MEIKYKKQAKIILNKCLEVKKSESILIITDEKRKDIAESIYNVAKNIAKKVDLIEIPIPPVNGVEPPEEVVKKMLSYNVILAPTTRSITHTNSVKNAVKNGARVATLPGITEAIMNESMLADYDKVEKFTLKVSGIVKNSKKVGIKTSKGTNITFSVATRKWIADTGKIGKVRNSGNLPGGEVFIAPLEGTANGKIMIDSFRKDEEIYAHEGTEIIVKQGNAISVSDKESKIAKLFKEIENATNLAEFGIGTNYKAKIIGNTLQDEKAIGTCHIAFGSNFSFGGKVKAGMHLDLIIKEPTITIDGKIIMKSGKFS